MKYSLNEIPRISELYGYANDNINNRVLCSASGQIKVLNCNPELLEEVLSYVDGNNTFAEIENKFIERYHINEVRNFLEVILKENVIERNIIGIESNRKPKILVIGNGKFAETIINSQHILIDRFLSRDFIGDYDIAIIAPSELTYSELFKINEKLYYMKKPYIQISYNGAKISLGPLVVPNKSACLECGASYELKRLNSKVSKDKRINITDLKNLKYCCNLPKHHDISKILYIIDLLCNDITNYYNDLGSEFLDVQYFFDLKSINFVKEQRLATTYCDCCNAFNRNYIKLDPSNVDFVTLLNGNANVNTTSLVKQDIKYSVGGLRSKTEEETMELLNADLNKLGASVIIEPSYGNPFNDNEVIHCYNSFVKQTNIHGMPFLFRKNQAAGKGLTKSQSYFSAAFELLEHMSLQYSGDIPLICAKYEDVKEVAIDMPYLASTIMNKNTAFDNFDEKSEMDWVVATSLTDGSKKLVPAFLVFMYDVELKGNFFGLTSSGGGAGTTLEDAILHGLFEAVERDAWLIGQCNPYILPEVDYKSITNSKIKDIISKIKEMGYEIITRDYTNDLMIPVYRTWIFNKNNYSRYAYMGFGCHVSPEIALERSITEAVQVDDWSTTGGDVDSDMITRPVLDNSLSNLYNQHFLVNKDILGKPNKTTKMGEPIFEMSSTYEVIEKMVKLIKEKIDGDVYYVELTKPEMNVKVIRIVITGDFQNMNIPMLSVSKRMFEFGIRCGYNDKKTTYEELFMGKYQH